MEIIDTMESKCTYIDEVANNGEKCVEYLPECKVSSVK